ncbi:hypothetical protein CWR43_28960 [Rhizobium sullae]|uniref:DUF930 domain-containing protein n=1 Tax=Rhizobium sullae TaxID=50338 RepID=A0A2N0D398_RHISU|nr:DUF930 domain-containing protein [Rhizobium sullae]PKA40591.1 hypothetical protein CWR43_28960 [Rhizobium sullae]
MQKIVGKRWREISWGVTASIALHIAVVAFFLVKLPDKAPQPPEEETVNVDLVPPPEEEKQPEEKKAEEKKAEEKKAEEQKPPEKPPELPKIEEKAEEKPPAPPPPPPPPPPAPPEAKPEKKPSEPPKSEARNDPSGKEGKGQPMPVLRPVFEFGDKDSGPRKSETGNASAESGKPPVTPPDEPKPEEPKPVETAAVKPPVTDKPPANPVPDDVDLPQVEAADVNPENSGPAAGAEDDAKTGFEQAKPADKPNTDQTEVAKVEKPTELKEAKTLFSQNATDDPVAKTAMGNLPRGIRAAQLCGTELLEQLRHSSPTYQPEMLPSYRLPRGTILDVRSAAFRAGGRWYNLSFRCEIDADATKVVSFGFNVGGLVPRSEYARHQITEY